MKKMINKFILSLFVLTMVLPTVAFASDDIDAVDCLTEQVEVALASFDKQSPKVENAAVVRTSENTTVTYQISGTGEMIGEEITVIAVTTELETGRVITIPNSVTVEEDTTTVSVTVDHEIYGKVNTHYAVNEIGAVIKNSAPSKVPAIRGKSTQTGAIVSWDAAPDDYNNVVYDVYKDGVLWKEGIQEREVIFPMDVVKFLKFYVIARDNEGLSNVASDSVEAGKYLYKFVEFNSSYFSDTSPIVVQERVIGNDAGIGSVEMTGPDTVDGDGVTDVTLRGFSTFSGQDRADAGTGKNWATRIQFIARDIFPTDRNPDHVIIKVKYFDDAPASVTMKYAKDDQMVQTPAWNLIGDGKWKEVILELTDASFARLNNGVEGCDFLFTTGAKDEGHVIINKVTVVPYEYWMPED